MTDQHGLQPSENEMDTIRQEALEFAGIGLYRYTFDGTIVFIDRGALRIFEADERFPDPAQLTGHNIGELFIYISAPGLLREELRARRRIHDFEYQFKTLTGKIKWVLNDSYIVDNPQTGEEAVQAIIHDITDRKQVETAFEESERRFRALLETVPLVAVMLDRKGTITFFNTYLAAITGWQPEEVIGQNWITTFIPPEIQEEIRAFLEAAIDSGEIPIHYRNNILTRTGERRLIAWNNTLLLNAEGQPSGVASLGEDITERRQARVALERERAFLASTIEILPLPLVFLGPGQVILRANEASRKFLDAHHIDLWGNVEMLTPDTRITIPRELWPGSRAMDGGEIISSAERILVTPDGHEIPVLIYAAPINIEGERSASVLAIQDITEFKAADRAKDEFLAILSHELRTPLTTILGWTQMALAASDLELMTTALHTIEQSAQRQRQILNNLIDVSRIISGKLYPRPERVDLWKPVEDVLRVYEERAKNHGITLRSIPLNEPLPIYVDVNRIKQAIENLLDNSLRFTSKGGEITVTGYRNGDWAMLSIHDTGRGIPQDMLHHLFKPFQQIERTEVTGGLGLGLALVKGIMDLSGGHVFATSPGLNQGSTFTLQFPLTKRYPPDI
ncbi:MAG TPA: PAS domain S-box protein, partial [Armatimonadota bacterium]